ncbi:MAG: TIGR02147 family protein [Bacteriovoracia bacterium]
MKGTGGRPDIHQYHDHRAFLRDWFAFKKTQDGTSVREFARRAKFSEGFLPLVMNGKRALTDDVARQLLRHMDLNESETSFFQSLRQLSEKNPTEDRQRAYRKLQRFGIYRRHNPKEFEAYRYLSRWYYVVIREMAGFAHFQLEARWIQARLKAKVSLREIQHAIDFLLKHGFVARMGKSDAGFPEGKSVDCDGQIYRLALSEFHKTMLGMAVESIHSTPRDDRNILGFTIGMHPDTFGAVKEVMERAMNEIRGITQAQEGRSSVYHVSFVAFPVVESDNPKKSQGKI